MLKTSVELPTGYISDLNSTFNAVVTHWQANYVDDIMGKLSCACFAMKALVKATETLREFKDAECAATVRESEHALTLTHNSIMFLLSTLQTLGVACA
jgi:hypothetical protein